MILMGVRDDDSADVSNREIDSRTLDLVIWIQRETCIDDQRLPVRLDLDTGATNFTCATENTDFHKEAAGLRGKGPAMLPIAVESAQSSANCSNRKSIVRSASPCDSTKVRKPSANLG